MGGLQRETYRGRNGAAVPGSGVFRAGWLLQLGTEEAAAGGVETMTQTGIRIRAIRESLGLTQEQLAKRLRVSVARVELIETGETFLSREMCERIDLLADSMVEVEA